MNKPLLAALAAILSMPLLVGFALPGATPDRASGQVTQTAAPTPGSVQKVISKDGTPIAYERIGSGPAVILVDGAFVHRTFGPMTPVAQRLAQHFTVFTYDRRGRGDSGDTQPYSGEREEEDIDALIQLAGGSAYLYGASSGAVLALQATSKLPGVKKLAMYEPPYVLDDSRPPVPRDFLDQLTQMRAEGRRGDMVEYFLTKGVDLPAETVAQMRSQPVWPELEAVAPTLVYDADLMGDFSRPNGPMYVVQIPTLLMAGGASPEWLQHAAKAVAEGMHNARFRLLPGQTHDAAPDAIAPELEAFFAG